MENYNFMFIIFFLLPSGLTKVDTKMAEFEAREYRSTREEISFQHSSGWKLDFIVYFNFFHRTGSTTRLYRDFPHLNEENLELETVEESRILEKFCET